jgi:molybdopterin-guanine dinucleotide biosynthesis protein A
VVLAPDAPEPSTPVGVPARVVRDTREDEGPLAGLHAGLLAVRTDYALVAGGDMPDLRRAVLLELLRVLDQTPADAAALQDGDRVCPLPCALHREPATDAAHALLDSGRRRLGDLLDALRVAIVDEATWNAIDPDRRTLFDVDTPDDLAR